MNSRFLRRLPYEKSPSTSRFLLAAALAALLLALPFLLRPVCASSAAQVPRRPPNGNITTTLGDQTDLALTVYNSNLVSRARCAPTDAADRGIAPQVHGHRRVDQSCDRTFSVADSDPGKLGVLEQNYEFDLLEPAKLLHKYVGKEVTLMRGDQEVKATLLSDNGGQVWKIGNDIVTNVGYNSIRFPKVAGQSVRPADAAVDAAEFRRTEAQSGSFLPDFQSFLERGLRPECFQGRNERRSRWLGHAGQSHRNRIQECFNCNWWRAIFIASWRNMRMDEMKTMSGIAKEANAPAPFQQESFSEYHLYSLNRRTSVFDQESKQISLLNASRFPLRKMYVVNGQTYYYRSVVQPGAPVKDPVQVFYKFKNEEKSGLGMPLPAGTVRVYQQIRVAVLSLPAKITSTTRPRTKRSACTSATRLTSWPNASRPTTRNSPTGCTNSSTKSRCATTRPAPITVQVNEPIGGDWEMVNSTYKFTKTAAFAAQFDVPVDKDGTSVLKYRVRVKY